MINNKAFIKNLKKKSIFMFNNYIDLAGYTSCLNIINSAKLNTIITDTLADFNENKKQKIYYQTPLYISYIENDLTNSTEKWMDKEAKSKLCNLG